MDKQELATKIWVTANELRKNIKATAFSSSATTCSAHFVALA